MSTFTKTVSQSQTCLDVCDVGAPLARERHDKTLQRPVWTCCMPWHALTGMLCLLFCTS